MEGGGGGGGGDQHIFLLQHPLNLIFLLCTECKHSANANKFVHITKLQKHTPSYHSCYYNVLHNTVQQLNSDLSAELKVGHHYGNLGAGDDEDDKDEEEEAKKVVEQVLPDGRQDEEQLNKHSSKREDACYH